MSYLNGLITRLVGFATHFAEDLFPAEGTSSLWLLLTSRNILEDS